MLCLQTPSAHGFTDSRAGVHRLTIGTEIQSAMNRRSYPSLKRRKLASYERAFLEQEGYILPATCTVIRAVEVDEVRSSCKTGN